MAYIIQTGRCKKVKASVKREMSALVVVTGSRKRAHRDGYQTSDSTVASFFLVSCHDTNALRNWSHAMKNEITEKMITSMSSLL